MRFFYARCSTRQQNEARQIEYARELGIEDRNIFIDKASGKNTERPALNDMLSRLREGDEVNITELSRLGRNTQDLLNLMDRFKELKVEVKSKKENIDTSTPAGQLVFTIFASIAQFQREIILENAAEGREAARAQGKPMGRPKVNQDKLGYAIHLFETDGEKSIAEISKETGLSRSTIYREADKRGVKRARRHRKGFIVPPEQVAEAVRRAMETSMNEKSGNEE